MISYLDYIIFLPINQYVYFIKGFYSIGAGGTREKGGYKMPEKDRESERADDFGYMEELSRAYREALTRRITSRESSISEEKRDLLGTIQREILYIAESTAREERGEARRELALMIRESAEECLRALSIEAKGESATLPSLSRAVLLANRALNLLIRHAREESKLTTFVLSELSALYALAAIN